MEEYKDIDFKEIDIENDDDGEILTEKYQIRSVPTTMLLDENNKLIYKISGNISEKDLISIINDAFKNNNIS
jgi:thioredoxin-related protein